MKLTKIVSTLGPVTESEEQIGKLIDSGVNVFRLNMKHNNTEWHSMMVDRIRKVSVQRGVIVGELLDLQGPEIRLTLPNEEAFELHAGQEVPLVKQFENRDQFVIGLTHPDVIDHLHDGQLVLADDGAFEFKIKKVGDQVSLVSGTTGKLKHRKTLNLPGADFPIQLFTDRDFEGIGLAAEKDVTYVALSFVRSAEDVMGLRKELEERGCNSMIVSKIENQKAIDNLDEIIAVSDAMMVARGDLGVELPFEQVPFYAREILRKGLETGKPVITATQMLESMIENPLATRAEVSDVASAVYESTDAVMLSGETASGKHPVKAVKVMARTVTFTESKITVDLRKFVQFNLSDQTQLLSEAAYNLSRQSQVQQNDLAGFIVFSQSGYTARALSNFKPTLPIYALCPYLEACKQLSLYFGVTPFLFEESSHMEDNPVEGEQLNRGIRFLEDWGVVKRGQKFIVMHGDYWAQQGRTSTIKLMKV